ncbi:hypothetical protein [Candidatus Nitrosocosmicus sp. SS]|uniref:hypothetical protein n=2 Tax=Candidatus Nitrosocosmicus agrestis TaxID=2563600 RepID=UPI00122DE11E|nr:hypothetical protein [Candidatus Nitrosocosmicus sp. SS]KAA2281227.1 hypothetical protein F1Z66_08900 [Candidatus Nitrosocosmicus sp. SS]KAF0868358.1 hypothetical protein E5N71_10405 [Candidatus Nitrosocosmicus sp. SS]
MNMSNIPIISIKDSISPHLAIRKSVISFFEKDIIHNPSYQLKIDFSEVKSISHSFANQYLLSKKDVNKEINEINMPSNVAEMISLAQNAIDSPKRTEPIADQEIPTEELKQS